MASIDVESDWLPPAELERLLASAQDGDEAVEVSVQQPEDRFVDPDIAMAAITATPALLLPFLSKLAERLFKAKPDATMVLASAATEVEVVIASSMPAADREALVEQTLASGVGRIRITAM